MDLFGEEFQGDPYRVYAGLRASEPVHRVLVGDSGLYGWVVTRYEDVRAVLADPRMSKDPRVAPEDWQAAGRGRPLEDRSGLGCHLLTTDPPDHGRLRRSVARYFTSGRIQGLRALIQSVADGLVDEFVHTGRADLVAEYATPLPIAVICDILGIPDGDRGGFRQWSADVISHNPGEHDPRPAALRNLAEYLGDLANRKRREPGDDVVSGLVADENITEAERTAMLFLLLIAGFETTISLIGNGVAALLHAPEQRELIRQRPDLLTSAIEEILRYDGPVELATWRFPTDPVEIGGVHIPAGAPVLAGLASAGRDIGPDRLDVTRRDNPHLAFGHGVHYCLGAPLARLEGRIALETLLRRLPRLEPVVPLERLQWSRTLTVRRLQELPVTF